MAFCKFCGSSIPDGAGFCPECGKKDPTEIHGALSLTAQDPSPREPLSRRAYFSFTDSADAKKRIRANRIALTAAVILVILWTVFVFVRAVLALPPDFRAMYIGFFLNRYFFGSAGLCILLMILTCVMKSRGCAIAALVFAVFSIVQFTSSTLVVGSGILLIAAVILLINTLKLEKEYRAYLERAGFATKKK